MEGNVFLEDRYNRNSRRRRGGFFAGRAPRTDGERRHQRRYNVPRFGSRERHRSRRLLVVHGTRSGRRTVLGSESSVARTSEHDAWRRTRGGAPSAVIVGIDLSGRNCQNYQQLLVLTRP